MSTSVFVKSQELAAQGDKLVREISESGDTCYITEDGRPKAVLLNIQRYNALMDLIEESESPLEQELQPPDAEVSVRQILETASTRLKRKTS